MLSMIAPRSRPAPASPAQIDAQALMAIRNLELRARTIVQGFWSGIHRSPYHGFSVEFTEYRQYTTGDDPRYLDWRVFARTDRYFIKKYEDETNVRCYLLLDQSRSMDYGSGAWTKGQYAATIAATLGYFLHLQGDAVGLLTFDEKVRDYLPARHRAGHLRQLMLALDRPASGGRTDVVAAIERITRLMRKRGLITLISDFLTPIESLQSKLLALAACGHEVDVFHVLDPVELTLGLNQASRFEDLESGREVYVDPVRARADYVRRINAHVETLRRMCGGLGAGYHLLSTAEPPGAALFGFLQQRLQRARGQRLTRNRRPNGGRA